MGWLDLPRAAPEVAIGWPALRDAVRNHPAENVVVIGMGGSSLFPDVLGRALADLAGCGEARARRLRILDTTVPDAIEAFLAETDLTRTLFIVSSKSGSTIEPHAAFELVHARLVDALGAEAAGRHFVAITDPGSPLAKIARERGFLGTALGRPDVGGRFSALSPFGLLPAEAMGLDPEALLARARRMSAACAPFVSAELNPGVRLGLVLGTLARQGRDKLTLSTSPALEAFPDWIEQLVAESTGKEGRGIVPIAGGPLLAPDQVGSDRVFVDLALAGDDTRRAALDALEAAGHPVVRIELAEAADLVQEVFRWEIATAVAGSLLELNPFDQPDVEAAKQAARTRLAHKGGSSPAAKADFESEGASFFLSPAFERGSAGDAQTILAIAIGRLEPGDTFRINAFLPDTPAIRERLESIRAAVARARRVATALDFGPRYLHSTGQLQKGGPDRFVGLQLWQSAEARAAAGASPLAIPELGGDFDSLVEAQAAGDLAVLAERGRRVVGIDLGRDPAATLERLARWVEVALA
jgi:transaldolase/glucose-6-phosphate isomerase